MNKLQIRALVSLRLFIGWHFLYEGVVKAFNPQWSSKGYLLSSEWMKWFFDFLASDNIIKTIDYVNILGLLFVGLSLILGYLERIGTYIGVVLLLFYYLAHPALPGFAQLSVEGSYWIVNKNIVEAAALMVLSQFPTGKNFGFPALKKS